MATPTTQASRVAEILRNVEHHLLKLDLSLKVGDASQVEAKKPLLDALVQCKEMLEQTKVPAISSSPSNTPPGSPRVGARPLRTSVADYRRHPTKDNPVSKFRQSANQAMTEVREKLLVLKTALRRETDPNVNSLLSEWAKVFTTLEKVVVDAIQNYEATTMEVRHYCSLWVRVAEAKQLPPTDLTGTLDSYVEAWVDNQKKAKTRTIAKEVNPCFLQEFYFYMPTEAQNLVFKVFDEFTGLHDHFVGLLTLPIDDLKKEDVDQQWFPLTAKGIGHVGDSASVHVAFDYKPSFSSHAGMLDVTVLEAVRLVDDPDDRPSTYCKVALITKSAVDNKKDKDKSHKTTIFKKSDSPKWNETFPFNVIWEGGARIYLNVTIYETALGRDKYMGCAKIEINDLFQPTNAGKADKWAKVTPKLLKDKNNGSLRVSIRFREEKVLPDSGYDELLDWLLMDTMPVAPLLPKLAQSVPERREIFRTITSIFESKAKSVWFLQKIITDEINSTGDLAVLFRGNTIATICFDCYLHLAGQDLLTLVLGQPIREIYKSDRSCELDPERKEDSDAKFNLQKNLDYLTECLDRIWVNVLKYTSDLPISIRAVLSTLRTKVEEKWPNESVSHYICITSFVFLRFFCAAILGPQLFGLVDKNPNPLQSRNLTIISKTLMNLGNLVLFGKKEPYLVACNPWLEQNMSRMKQYVDSICAFVDPSQLPTRSTIPIDYAQEMSHIHRFLDIKAPKIKEVVENSWQKVEAPSGSPPAAHSSSPPSPSKASLASFPRKKAPLPDSFSDSAAASAIGRVGRQRSDSKIQRDILRTSFKQLIKDSAEEEPGTKMEKDQLTKYVVDLDKLTAILKRISERLGAQGH